jgi:hypothetical protein
MKRLFLLCLVGMSCQKIVTLKLATTAPQLVIQGDVNDGPQPYFVTLGQSVDFYASNNYPPVSGAKVVITDVTAGVSDTLTETPTAGTYQTSILQGMNGHTYNLNVLSGGATYTATSTIPSTFVVLDSVTFVVTGRRGKGQNISPVPNFQDPDTGSHYYQFVLYGNGVQVPKTYVFSDRLSQGRYIHEPLNTDTSDVQSGEELRVDLYCIDSDVYTYLNELTSITNIGAQSENAAPANPTSNITGGCLGYFSAHTVSEKVVLVPSF